MKNECQEAGILVRQHVITLKKELFRKSVHICSAFIPFFLHYQHNLVLLALCVLTLVYVIEEILRQKGFPIPVISTVTIAASRKRDENKFVLGPVTLCCGILLSALLWKEPAASIGIYALSFGDGLASLAGKTFGRINIPFTHGKTCAGTLTCFIAIFCSAFFVCKRAEMSFIIALVGMIIELFPLKDFDNIFIPVLIGGLAQCLFIIL